MQVPLWSMGRATASHQPLTGRGVGQPGGVHGSHTGQTSDVAWPAGCKGGMPVR